MTRMIGGITEVLAKRVGLPATDIRVRTFAGAILGVMVTVTMPHERLAAGDLGPYMFGQMDEALALLEAGLPLGD